MTVTASSLWVGRAEPLVRSLLQQKGPGEF
jgi:hypothetical protein